MSATTAEMHDYEKKSTERVPLRRSGRNVGNAERWASIVGGGVLAGYALSRRTKETVALALLGGALVHRGVTGRCAVYNALGISTTGTEESDMISVPYGHGTRVERAITIAKPPEELYRFWRRFENLPRFMNHLESVTELDARRSHWVAIGPADKRVEWDAEVHNEVENELIAWRSLEGSDVHHAGSVHFDRLPGERGTALRLVLEYDPPGGKLTSAIAKLFREDPATLIDEDLRRLKQIMEAGEVATTAGQPSAR